MKICKVCGKEVESYRENDVCFSCEYWEELYKQDMQSPPHTYAIINGTHYVIGDENSKETYFRGFGGQKFKIKFFDGTEVTTTNLWYQGIPPEHFKDKFPDNAQFIRRNFTDDYRKPMSGLPF